MQNTLSRIFKSEIIATLAMTLVMLAAPMMGMPKMPIGNMLANFMHLPVAAGWIAHFMIGLVLATSYVAFFINRFSIPSWLNGALYALIPFFMAQLLVMPMMGAGFFSANTAAPLYDGHG